MSVHDLLTGYPSTAFVFFISAAVGLAAALPLGPISILSIQRAATFGFWRAFRPTLGAVVADGLLGIMAALGSGIITSFILGNSFWLKLAGSVLMLALGARMLTLRSSDRDVPGKDFDPFHLTTLYFAIILSNPLTLAFFMATFTFLGLHPGRHIMWYSLVAGCGVALGTLIWFAFICGAAGVLHRRLGDTFLSRTRASVGVLIIVIALLSAASALMAG